MDKPLKVMLVAGEASGDRHAAKLFLELKGLIPQVSGLGMGGPHMNRAGVDIRYDSSRIGVIGLGEVLRHYGEIRRALRLMQRTVREERPALLICVDYKEFNLKLAQYAKAQGVKVLFYVSPQVWAWRPGRVKSYGRAVDMMAVIFPFEAPFYQRYHIPVRYVGHPLAGNVYAAIDKPAALKELDLNSSHRIIGLLPGSRGNEIRRLMPIMLQAARLLLKRFPDARFVLFQASSVSDGMLERYLKDSELPIQVIKERYYEAMQCCEATITCSGTATLEVALMGIPMVIIYRMSALSYALGRLLVKTPFIGLANIVAGKGIVQELIQHQANPQKICAEITKILADRRYADSMRKELAKVKERLGSEGGSENLAQLAAAMLIKNEGLSGK